MPVATKTQIAVQSSTSNAAGATTTSAGVTISTDFGGIVVCRITNGATGPTIPCDAVVQISGDGTTWYEHLRATSNLGSNVVTDLTFEVHPGIQRFRVVFAGNTGQAVTVFAEYHQFTNTT